MAPPHERRISRCSRVPRVAATGSYRNDGEHCVRGRWWTPPVGPRRSSSTSIWPPQSCSASSPRWPRRAGRSPPSRRTCSRGLAVGLLLGVALAPLVAAVQRRWGRSRGVSAAIVGGALAGFFAAVVLLVAPPAVDQASQFSRELPATVRELYSWPVIGSRLEKSDAAGDVERGHRRAARQARRQDPRRPR